MGTLLYLYACAWTEANPGAAPPVYENICGDNPGGNHGSTATRNEDPLEAVSQTA
jgi:hypothetical protein